MANAMDELLSPFQGVKGPSEALPPPATPPPAPPINMPTPSYDETMANPYALNNAPVAQPVAAPAPRPEAQPAVTLAPQQPAPQPLQPAAPAMATQTETMTQKAPKLSAEQKTAEEDAFQKRLRAESAVSELQEAQALMQASDARYTAQKIQQQQQKDQAEAAKIQQDADKASKEWQGAIDEYKKIRKDGPEQLSTGQSILAAIAQGLGAFGSAMTGGPNQAMAIINKAADTRVRKWEKDLDEAKGSIDARHNAVAWFRQKGMDARSAAQAAKQAILDDAAMRGDALTAQYKSSAIKTAWEATKAGLEQQRIQTQNTRALDEQDKIVVKRTSAPTGGMAFGDQVKLRGLEVEVPQGEGKIAKFYAKTQEEAKAIRDAQKVGSGIRSDLLKMEALIAGAPTMNPQTRQKIEILNNSIRKKYIKLDELGVPTGKDLELSSVVGDPRAWTQTTGQTKDLINSVKTDVADRLTQAYETQGFRGVQ
jgi:hypothetical protein